MRPTTFSLIVAAASFLGAGVNPALLLAQATSVPATAPSEAEAAAAELEVQRKEWEAQLRALPAAKVRSLQDVVQFGIENDDVIVRTSVAPTELSAIVIDGKPALITVMAQSGEPAIAADPAPAPEPAPEPAKAPPPPAAAAVGQPYQPTVFSLVRHEYPPAPNVGVAITQINVVVPRVAISRSSENATEFRNVDFIQSEEFLEEGDERVRLYVQEHRNDEPVVDLKLSAMNVAELRRKYPAETMRYLEPIFRDFGQSGVLFRVNARAAWQVLGESYAPPAEVVKQVDALLVKLDAEDARQREAAARELDQLGQPAALVLMKRDGADLSEEQRSRVETFLAPYKPLPPDEAARMLDNTEFLLAALSAEEPELATRALERLKAVTKQPIAFDVRAVGPARADAIAKLRAQLLPATTRPATAQTTPRQRSGAEPAP